MMDYLIELAKLTIGPVVVVAAVAWISRLFISRVFDKKMEKYKSELERNNEKYRSELETIRKESQTKYSLFKHKQAEVIGVLYGMVVKSHRVINDLVNPHQSPVDNSLMNKKKDTEEIVNRADDYFAEHSIYLDDDLRQQIGKMFKIMQYAFNTFQKSQPGNNYTNDDTGDWEKAHAQIKENVPSLLREMHTTIRLIMDAKSES